MLTHNIQLFYSIPLINRYVKTNQTLKLSFFDQLIKMTLLNFCYMRNLLHKHNFEVKVLHLVYLKSNVVGIVQF